MTKYQGKAYQKKIIFSERMNCNILYFVVLTFVNVLLCILVNSLQSYNRYIMYYNYIDKIETT